MYASFQESELTANNAMKITIKLYFRKYLIKFKPLNNELN